MIKRFSPKLEENLNPLINRIRNKFASSIVIDGGLGQGKTTLAVQIADYINECNGLEPVDLEKNTQLAMGGDEFKEKLVRCYEQGLPALIYDEAGDFNNRGFITGFNKDLYRTFNIYRAYKILVILCLPSFTDLDSGLFKLDVIRFGLHLKGRNDKQGYFYGYSLRSLIYMRYAIQKRQAIPAFCYNGSKPNFAGLFKDLSPARAKQLEFLSTRAKLKTSTDMLKVPSDNIDISSYKQEDKNFYE